MIYSLRKKLIWISGVSVITVFIIIFAAITIVSIHQLNTAMDTLTDRISSNDGSFPEIDEEHPLPPRGFTDFITEETKFSTRFFTVRYNRDGNIVSADIEFVASVTEETARAYAREAMNQNRERGWIDRYRYKIYGTSMGQAVVFVDGNMNRSMTAMLLVAAGVVLILSLIIILILIIIFSKRAVRPVAESYEKQKQFITDASHELKTPLTLILTNLDIVEAEAGKNEWLDDIRAEGERMNELVRQLVTLTRMDEDQTDICREDFSLSDAVTDTVSEFQTLSEEKGKPIKSAVQSGVDYCGDESGIRRVVSILLDNALKYCDSGGEIFVSLTGKHHPVICVENTFDAVDTLERDKLFDRFYRGDSSRTFTGSFGIGLSIAKAVVQKHHGEIFAYKKDDDHIGFRVILK